MRQIKIKCGQCDFECVVYYDDSAFIDPEYCPGCGDELNLEDKEVFE